MEDSNIFVLFLLFQHKYSKKPYNPIVGEVFQCSWDVSAPQTQADVSKIETTAETGDCRVHYVGEQVSHHPPGTVCSYMYINEHYHQFGKLQQFRSSPPECYWMFYLLPMDFHTIKRGVRMDNLLLTSLQSVYFCL